MPPLSTNKIFLLINFELTGHAHFVHKLVARITYISYSQGKRPIFILWDVFNKFLPFIKQESAVGCYVWIFLLCPILPHPRITPHPFTNTPEWTRSIADCMPSCRSLAFVISDNFWKENREYLISNCKNFAMGQDGTTTGYPIFRRSVKSKGRGRNIWSTKTKSCIGLSFRKVKENDSVSSM